MNIDKMAFAIYRDLIKMKTSKPDSLLAIKAYQAAEAFIHESKQPHRSGKTVHLDADGKPEKEE